MNIFRHILTIISQKRVLLLSLIIIPALLALLYILMFGVNVLSWDQWELVPLVNDLLQGKLNVSQLFSQHNEHRIFFPRVAMLSIAFLTHYNTIAEMVSSWILLIITFSILYLLFKKKFGVSNKQLALFIPVAWLFFSTKQWENLLWGWQIQIFLCTLGFFIVVYFLEKTEKINVYFTFALIGGIIASYSFFNGLLVWIAGLFYLLATGKNRNLLLAWLLSTIIIYGIYFFEWVRPLHHPSPLFIFHDPVGAVAYFLANVGSGFTGGIWDDPSRIRMASLFGGLILLAIIGGLRNDYKNNLFVENAPWWTFIVFSLGTSIFLSIGRGGFGTGQSLTPRYVTFTIIGIIGIFLILNKNFEKFGSRDAVVKYLFIGFTGLMVLGIILGNIEGYNKGRTIQYQREETVAILLNYTTESDDQLKKLYPSADVIRNYAPILEKYDYNVFHDNSGKRYSY